MMNFAATETLVQARRDALLETAVHCRNGRELRAAGRSGLARHAARLRARYGG